MPMVQYDRIAIECKLSAQSSGLERTRKPASAKSRVLRVWNSSTFQYLSVSARRTSWMRRLAKLRDEARRHTAFMTSGDDGTSTTAHAGLPRYDDITAAASPAESGFFCRTGLRSKQYSSTRVCSATTKFPSSACASRKARATACFGSSGQDAAKRMFVSHETMRPPPLFASVFVNPRAPVLSCERVGAKAGGTAYRNRPAFWFGRAAFDGMDAYVEFNGVAAYFGQTDFAVVRKSLGAPIKAVGKLYLSPCHGVNYTSSSVWCQWGNMNSEISNLGMDAHRRIRRGGLARAESQRRGE